MVFRRHTKNHKENNIAHKQTLNPSFISRDKNNKRQCKTVYLVFLDIRKAYDKVKDFTPPIMNDPNRTSQIQIRCEPSIQGQGHWHRFTEAMWRGGNVFNQWLCSFHMKDALPLVKGIGHSDIIHMSNFH